MKISIVTANYNGARFLESTIKSVIAQRDTGFELEYIVVDGQSTDDSLEIISKYADQIDMLVVEPDDGPFDAINKGLRLATGELLGWLNSDDQYEDGALTRVAAAMDGNPEVAICFGHCPIIDENGVEIRSAITRFKELFFPLSSLFTIQCINYISQPAFFFRRSAFEKGGTLREDFKAAWDYDLILRLWMHGGALVVDNPPLANFRWREDSISGRHFRDQFREEVAAAASSAGRFSIQSAIHTIVRIGIVSIYTAMEKSRLSKGAKRDAPRHSRV